MTAQRTMVHDIVRQAAEAALADRLSYLPTKVRSAVALAAADRAAPQIDALAADLIAQVSEGPPLAATRRNN